jgi:hypothetical protein
MPTQNALLMIQDHLPVVEDIQCPGNLVFDVQASHQFQTASGGDADAVTALMQGVERYNRGGWDCVRLGIQKGVVQVKKQQARKVHDLIIPFTVV